MAFTAYPGKMIGRKGICVVYHSKEETNIDMIDSNIYNKTSVKWYDHNIIWTKKRKGSKEISIFTMTQFYIFSQESLVTSADYDKYALVWFLTILQETGNTWLENQAISGPGNDYFSIFFCKM